MWNRVVQFWTYIRTGLDIANIYQLIGLAALSTFITAGVRIMMEWWQGQDAVAQILMGVAIWLAAFVLLGKLWSALRSRSSETPKDATLIEVKRRTYEQGETVIIDGHSFDECTFKDCTLVYNGGNYKIGRNKLERPEGVTYGFASTNQTIVKALSLMNSFKLLNFNAMAQVPLDSLKDGNG